MTDRCSLCEGPMKRVRERVEFPVRSRNVAVEIERSRCTECGEILYSPEQMDAAQRAASDELRRQDGLLRATEIRDIRNKYKLTQAQFEQLLGVGPKTVVRWERGTVAQNRATDELVRVISAVPEAFEYLARKNGVRVSTAAGPRPSDVTVQGVQYAAPREEDRRRVDRRVVSFVAFREKSAQRRVIPAEPEVAVAAIPEEAMK